MPDLAPLPPKYWFTLGHGVDGGHYNSEHCWMPTLSHLTTFLWAPPPAAAYAAIDELALSRYKRPHLRHLFICPRLCTHMWRKKLYKTANLVLDLSPPPALPSLAQFYA
jgi:hypothetical protein